MYVGSAGACAYRLVLFDNCHLNNCLWRGFCKVVLLPVRRMNNLKRATNFSAREESLVVSLVKKYKHKVECKKSDTDTNKMKKEIWATIEKEFNALSGETHRDARTLKNKYENIKKRSKKKYADEKCQLLGTGGGPPKHPSINGLDEQIKEILGVRLEGLPSEFDDDTLAAVGDIDSAVNDESLDLIEVDITNNTSHVTEMQYEVSVDMEKSLVDISEDTSDTSEIAAEKKSGQKVTLQNWSKPSPQQLRTPKSAPLRMNKQEVQKQKTEMTSKLAAWAASKVTVESVKERCIIEEHTLKMELMREKHKKELLLMDQEYEKRTKQLDEIHELQKTLLKEKINGKK